MLFFYFVLNRGGTIRQFPLDRPQVLGRSEHVDIHLRDLRVSRLHARITLVNGQPQIEDVGSSNFTLINGQRLQVPTLLYPGDVVQVGPYELVVEVRQGWVLEEPGWQRARMELGRLKRRARARPILVTFFTLLLALAIGYRSYRKKPKTIATVTFLVSEGESDVTGRAYAELRQYVFDAVLTRATALTVIKKLDLYPAIRRVNENWAVDLMRDHIDIGVHRNQFIQTRSQFHWRSHDDRALRSATVSISYTGVTPRESLKVARELAHKLQEHEESIQTRRAAYKVQALEETIKRVGEQLDDVLTKRSLAQRVMVSTTASGGMIRAAQEDFKSYTDRLTALEIQSTGLIAQLAKARLMARREMQAMGIRFEIVDWGREHPPPPLSAGAKASLVGSIMFLILLPFVGIVVGALDDRLYSGEDVDRLGIPALGHVRHFKGDTVGSFKERMQREKESGPESAHGGSGRGSAV